MMINRFISDGNLTAMNLLFPMIPNRTSKKRYPEQPQRYMEPEFIAVPFDDNDQSKECAICRRGNADYEHSCGVAFHKACIHQYFDAISAVAGAERICPHCYAPMPLDLDEEAAVEVSPILDDVYNQYLELSDVFSLALIDGRIRDVSVFLESPTKEQYLVNVDFGLYPKKPTFSFTDDLLANMDGLEDVLEMLNNWDEKLPPRVVDVLLDIQGRIRPREIKEPMVPLVEEEDVDAQEEKEDMEVVEVVAEEDIVEVTLEGESENDYTPAHFFELEPYSEEELPMARTIGESFENEEAISQYLDISNSFSVELMDDEVYNIIVQLSSLDGGIYNIYPVTTNFRNYPEKPQMTFTDELLVRIRGLDEIIITLKFWDPLNPPKIVDILTELETKLMEDSLLENEIEMLKREYNTRRINKNRIMVTIKSYGQKAFNVELNFRNYPHPPLIYLPEELRSIDFSELEGIKKWQERPQKRIMDVLRSLTSAINNLYRMDFEELLLRMVARDYDFSNTEYKLEIKVPITSDGEGKEGEQGQGTLFFNIQISENYPITPPKIQIDSDSEELKRDANTLLTYMLKSWSPSMFLMDVVNRLSLSLSNTSLYKCIVCGEKECPTCGLPLLTQPVADTQQICEVPCIHCKRPYHVHCLSNAMDDGMKRCGLCLSDLTRFFGKRPNELSGL